MISEEFTMRIQPQRQSGGLLFLHHGSFLLLLLGRGAGGLFFSPGPSASGEVWRHISPSPRVLPPPSPLKIAKLAREGGEGPGGKEKYAARLPSDGRCQFLWGYSGSEPGGCQFLRDYNVAERGGCKFIADYTMSASSGIALFRNTALPEELTAATL